MALAGEAVFSQTMAKAICYGDSVAVQRAALASSEFGAEALVRVKLPKGDER